MYVLADVFDGGHGHVALHLSLIDAENCQPHEVTAENQRPESVPHRRIRIETKRQRMNNQWTMVEIWGFKGQNVGFELKIGQNDMD